MSPHSIPPSQYGDASIKGSSPKGRFSWFGKQARPAPAYDPSVSSVSPSALMKAHKDLQVECDINKKQYHVAATELLHLSSDIADLKKKTEHTSQLQADVQRLYELLDTKTDEVDDLKKENFSLNKRIVELTNEASELRAVIDKDTDQFMLKNGKLEKMAAEIAELKEKLNWAEEELVVKISCVSEDEDTIKILHAIIKAKEVEIEARRAH
jgi:predicted  nucleic acid-binding Zn-ribbon protein